MRLAELLGSLSLATDLADGFALEKCLRTSVLATRLAGALGLSDEQQSSVYWSSLLRFTGCTAFAHEEGKEFSAGDDVSLRRSLAYVDFGRPSTFVTRVVRGLAPEQGPLRRAGAVLSLLSAPSAPRRHAVAQCEVGQAFARGLGMPDVAEVLGLRAERWDGAGPRRKARGDELPLAARIADVADAAELFCFSYGHAPCREELRARRGGELDPSIVDALLATLPQLAVDLFEPSIWELFLETEPSPQRVVGERAEVTRLLGVFSGFADIASTYTLDHSRRVAELAHGAAQAAGLDGDAQRLVLEAGYSHDLGRVAVPNGIWEKRGALTPAERERVRTHSQHTESVLRLSPALRALAELAGSAHERAGRRGYHRRLDLLTSGVVPQLLAAADVYVAMDSERPHRPRLSREAIVRELRALADAGELEARSTRCVLEAAGEPRPRSAKRHDLTEREVEVVRLVAIGRTNREIGALLGMSPRTAQKHVMNVYDKLGLESRAALALFAVEHDLLQQH